MSLSIRIAVIVSSFLGLLALLASTAVGQALHNEPALRSAIAAQMAQGPQNEAAWSSTSATATSCSLTAPALRFRPLR